MNPPTLLRKFISPLFGWRKIVSACYQQTQTWKQRKEFKEKKVEDCAWTPVVDETLLKFLESVEHKSGWYPFENGHAQVAYRAKALRTPDSHYDRKKFTWELLLWRGKEFGGCLRWIMTWTRKMFSTSFGRRSWSTCFSLLTFRAYLSCHDTTVDTWDCWRTLGTLHGPCEWQ